MRNRINRKKERKRERDKKRRQKKRKAFLVRSVASGSITLTNGVNLSHRPLWKWNDFSGKHFNMYVCTLRYENWEEPERDWKWFLIRIARDEFHWQTSGSHVTERKWWRHRPSSRQLGGGFFSRSPRLTRHELLCKSTPPPSAPLCPSPFPLRSGFHYPIKMRLELTLQQSTRLSHNKSNKQMVNQHHDVLPSPLPPPPPPSGFHFNFSMQERRRNSRESYSNQLNNIKSMKWSRCQSQPIRACDSIMALNRPGNSSAAWSYQEAFE